MHHEVQDWPSFPRRRLVVVVVDRTGKWLVEDMTAASTTLGWVVLLARRLRRIAKIRNEAKVFSKLILGREWSEDSAYMLDSPQHHHCL